MGRDIHDKRVYELPQPRERALECGPMIWDRGRISIPCFSFEDALELSARIAKFTAHDVERIMGVTDSEATENLGEIVLERKFVPIDLEGLIPVEETETEVECEV